MIRFVLFVFAAFSTYSFGADLKVSKTVEMQRSVEDLLSVITDYSQFCRGYQCAYRVPSIREFKVLERGENEVFMWQSVEATVKSSVFYKSVEKANDDGSVLVRITYPSQSELQYLSSTYALASEQPFDSFNATWKLTPLNNGKTSVEYVNVVESRNLARPSFRNLVQRELTDTIEDYFRNLDLNRTWMTCKNNTYCSNGWGWVQDGAEGIDFGNKPWSCSADMGMSWKEQDVGCSCRCM